MNQINNTINATGVEEFLAKISQKNIKKSENLKKKEPCYQIDSYHFSELNHMDESAILVLILAKEGLLELDNIAEAIKILAEAFNGVRGLPQKYLTNNAKFKNMNEWELEQWAEFSLNNITNQTGFLLPSHRMKSQEYWAEIVHYVLHCKLTFITKCKIISSYIKKLNQVNGLLSADLYRNIFYEGVIRKELSGINQKPSYSEICDGLNLLKNPTKLKDNTDFSNMYYWFYYEALIDNPTLMGEQLVSLIKLYKNEEILKQIVTSGKLSMDQLTDLINSYKIELDLLLLIKTKLYNSKQMAKLIKKHKKKDVAVNKALELALDVGMDNDDALPLLRYCNINSIKKGSKIDLLLKIQLKK